MTEADDEADGLWVNPPYIWQRLPSTIPAQGEDRSFELAIEAATRLDLWGFKPYYATALVSFEGVATYFRQVAQRSPGIGYDSLTPAAYQDVVEAWNRLCTFYRETAKIYSIEPDGLANALRDLRANDSSIGSA